MYSPILRLALLCILSFSVSYATASVTAQYCKDDSAGTNQAVNFCVKVLNHWNATTDKYDVHLALTHKRFNASSDGWIAVGAGGSMTGGLMFIVYGDPLSNEPPIVSIRESTGHVQPKLLQKHELPQGLDFKVIESGWRPAEEAPLWDGTTYEAAISLVCYDCQSWTGTTVSVQDNSMPWMWAWNGVQKFDVFAYDAHLKMHKHHAGAGGWGNFYVDMSSAVDRSPGMLVLSTKIMPDHHTVLPETLSISNLSDMQQAFNATLKPVWHVHGISMATAFLVLFPLGILLMRSGSPSAYTLHWVVQVLGSIMLLVGCLTGLALSSHIDTVHQSIGSALISVVILQIGAGWRHHIVFLRLRRRTWVSHVHIWLGRAMMLAGWSNIVTGVMMRQYSKGIIIAVISLSLMETVGVFTYVWWKQKEPGSAREALSSVWQRQRQEKYTAIAGDESDYDSSLGGNSSP